MTALSARPLISVGMPVRNGAATVGLAVRSILAQTYDDLEVLLIDDGSTDATVAVMREFDDPRVRLFVDGEARGLSARRNEAVAHASGEVLAWMDGDDVAYPWRLERELVRLRAADQPDLVGAGMLIFRDDFSTIGVRRPATDHAAIVRRPTSGFAMANPTLIGRTSFFRRWSYRVGAVGMEDQDLLLRAYRDSVFANLPELLTGYREPRLNLGKILRARRYVATGFGQELLRQGRPGMAAQAVAGQAARAAVDVAAIGLRLDYRLLRHRALSATAAEEATWRGVLAGLDATSVGPAVPFAPET